MESTTQIFLLIAVGDEEDTVRGEGRIDRYSDRMQIEGFSFSMQAKENTVRQTKEETSSNVDMGTVRVSRPFDTASKRLSDLLANRTKFSEARLTVDQHMTWGPGEAREQNAIIVFHLLNGYVADQKFNAKEGDKGASISEQIELAFTNVAIEYYILNRKFRDSELRNYRENPVLNFATHNKEWDD